MNPEIQARQIAQTLTRHSYLGFFMLILLGGAIFLSFAILGSNFYWSLIAAVSGAVAQTYLLIRIKIDQRLFNQIARVIPERGVDQALDEIDTVLSQKYKVPAAKLGRQLSARIDGTQSLLTSHSILSIFNAAICFFCITLVFLKFN